MRNALRWLAWRLTRAVFRTNSESGDHFKWFAARMLGKKENEVTKDERRDFKYKLWEVFYTANSPVR